MDIGFLLESDSTVCQLGISIHPERFEPIDEVEGVKTDDPELGRLFNVDELVLNESRR